VAEKAKEYPLSIVIKTVDRATAGIRLISERVNALKGRLDRVTAPARAFGRAFGQSLRAMGTEAGLPKVMGALRGVGGAVKGLLAHVGMIGGVAAGAAAGAVIAFKSMVDSLDDLGDMADRVGLTVDALAQLRFAAQVSGGSVEDLDSGLGTFNRSLGQLSAGTGKLFGFLKRVSPEFLRQVKGAKTSEEAFGLMADAIAQLKDPTQRAALAAAAFGGAGGALVPLLAKGSAGIKELKERYAALAGSQTGAAEAAGKVDDSFHDLKAATDGVKAALVEGLAPAFVKLIGFLQTFFAENRARIAEWAKDFGEKLPARIDAVVAAFQGFIDAVKPVWDAIGGLRGVAIALAAILGGKLVLAVYALGTALLTTPVGWIIGGIAALVAAGAFLVRHWDQVKLFLVSMWEVVQENFATIWGWIKTALAWTPLGPIIENWGPITDFFKGLWDGVTAVFVAAWDIIKGIVDKIVWAVDKVKGAAHAVREYFGGGSGETTSLVDVVGGLRKQGLTQAQAEIQGRKLLRLPPAAAPAAGKPTETRVIVDFANAPKGTRVRTDSGTADVDFSVGYQMALP
jgi:phage-related minor tail protein